MDDHNTNPDTTDPGSPKGANSNRGDLLAAQQAAWQRGEPLPVESYLALHPELQNSEKTILDLLCQEIRLRRRHGEQPEWEEYRTRFPQYGAQLHGQFDSQRTSDASIDPLSKTQPDLSPHEPAISPPTDVGGYEILQEMGRGGMGIVYKARHRGLNRLGALKMIYPGGRDGEERLARFRGEAEALARLEHPHIVQIYDVGEHQGRPYLVMEFLTGQSLEDHLQGKPQPARQAAELIELLARAVHYAHQRGIIHRDLKPANVMLPFLAADTETSLAATRRGALSSGALGIPKITDFGLAKLVGAGPGQTRSGDILGTPSYMAPEQARGDHAAVGPRTDIYSLGAILYTLLTGRPPFHADSVWETMNQVERQEPIPPRQFQPHLPRDLETICLKCLQKEPKRRYASADDLASDLHRFLNDEPIRARPTPLWERGWKWVKRRPTIAAVSATAVVLLAVLVTAHYVHLRSELTKAQSAMAFDEVERALVSIETEINAGNWQQANQQQALAFQELLLPALAAYSPNDRLTALADRAKGLEQQIASRLTDQERLTRFRGYRDEVADLTTPFLGMAAAPSQSRARADIIKAFALFHITIEGQAKPILDAPHFTQAEKDEVRESCAQMLLELAGCLMETGQNPKTSGALYGHRLDGGKSSDSRDSRDSSDDPRQAGGYIRYPAQRLLDRAATLLTPQTEAVPVKRSFEFYLQGCELTRAGQWLEAIKAFEAALERQPDHYGAHHVVSICYLKLPRTGNNPANLLLAREHLNRCIQLRSSQVWPYLERGHVNGELSAFDAAEADFGKAEELLSTSPDETALYALLNSRGVSRIGQKQLANAIADLKRAIALQPNEIAGHVNLAKAYQEQKRLTEATAELDYAIALKPPRMLAALYRSRSRLRQERDDWAGALADAERTQQLDEPSSGSALEDWRRISRLALKCAKPDKAVKAADALLVLDASDAGGHRLRAEGLLEQKRFGEAAQSLDLYFEAAGASGRIDIEAYHARARARTALGDYEAAAEDYGRILDQKPNDKAARAGRGWLYLVLEAPKLALHDFEQLIKIDKEIGDGYNGRGYALVRLGKDREAARDAEEALRLGPRQARMLYNASRIFAQAVQQSETDPLEQTPRGKRERQDYEDRALRLLNESMAKLPAGDRGFFWKETVERDAALTPLRRNPRFVKMAESYSGPSS